MNGRRLNLIACALAAMHASLYFARLAVAQPKVDRQQVAENSGSSIGSKESVTSQTSRSSENRSTEKVRPRARATQGRETLPNDQGQIWQEYDLRPYTSKITGTNRPEQAVVDWILRETGTELWFSEPLGILNASRDTLRVYHTPDVQQIVLEIVDRLIASEGEQQVLGLHLVTIGSPNWRSKAFPMLQPVVVQNPGMEAWLLSRENAALLKSELRRRTDFREHNTPNLVIQNGQSQTISRTQPRTYPRTARARENGIPGIDLVNGQIDEGYSLQISTLLALDNRSIDAVIRCQIDQVEKFVPVTIDIPGGSNSKQSLQVQVPQLVTWRLHERFHWPTDQVLLLSCGIVATPAPERFALKGISLNGGATRADALLFIESRGPAKQVLLENPPTSTAASPNSRGRY